MAIGTLTAQVRVAWWLKPYLASLVFFCNVTGAEPDWEKLERVIGRAIKIEIGRT